MEGLIPFVYRAVMQIRYGHERSSSYYVRLPGDSGRFGRTGLEVSGLGFSGVVEDHEHEHHVCCFHWSPVTSSSSGYDVMHTHSKGT
ncbi:unnamed protein product [Brassica oleracea var. botrytis]|uniref:Uncharacterized protein n=3 Tax=Brassica TaxID=3705 RepID=A0A8X7RN19_BRACI|nr:hypothetical protein Bca52824_049369 [Brassica carinata]KAG2289767.1 hypothetical protein Bca52824_049371 [Brassica carinata]VDD05659.1 unnamed protein product [Brassica oleracea]